MTAPKMSEVFELPLAIVAARGDIHDGDGFVANTEEVPSYEVPSYNAHAAAIVRAVNAHDALVEALRHARDQIQHPDQMIDEAIALAEGRS